MSSADGNGYKFTDGDYEALYWADPAPHGRWQAWIESNFSLSNDLPSGLRALPSLYASEHEATEAAKERIQGEVIWWRRRNDSFFDGTHLGVAYRILATRIGLPEEEGWKCVIQYDKPMQNGNGTEDSQRFASAEKALEHGKDVALHAIAHIVRVLQLDPETALTEAKARTVKLSDY